VKKGLSELLPVSLVNFQRKLNDVSYNRRRLLDDGTIWKGPVLPQGAKVVQSTEPDRNLSIVCFFNASLPEPKPIGALVHFACHPVVCCCDVVTCDFVGKLRLAIEEQLDCPAIFLQGACGDINPTILGTDMSFLHRFHEKVASQLTNIRSEVMSRFHSQGSPLVKFKGVSAEELLLYDTLPDEVTLKHELELLKRVAGGDTTSDEIQPILKTMRNIMNIQPGIPIDPKKASHCAQALANSRQRTIDYSKAPMTGVKLSMGVWIFGNTCHIVFCAAEMFNETGLHISGLSKDTLVLPVGYLSPIVGYLPCKKDIPYGGYEVEDAWRFYGHPLPFVPATEEKVRMSLTLLYKSTITMAKY